MPRSVRLRLTLWYVAVIALLLILFALATLIAVRYAANARTDRELADIAGAFIDTVAGEQREARGGQAVEDIVREALHDLRFRDYRFAVYDRTRALVARSPVAPRGRDALQSLLAPSSAMTRLIESAAAKGSAYATLLKGDRSLRAFAGRMHVKDFTVVIMRSLRDQNEVLEDFGSTILVIIPLSLLLTSVAGYLLARKALAPVVSMSRQADRISAINLHERLAIANPGDELGRLAHTLNGLLERLDAAFGQQRRFMADASHELRTPLAIVRGEADVALSKTDRPESEYRETLVIIRRECGRLAQIVQDMFTLARADAGQVSLVMSNLYLDELAQECARAARSLAAARRVTVETVTDGELPFRGDEGLLRRMILNLLDNAIKHTPRRGHVRVECGREGDACRIVVSDEGNGIPPHAQPHIFERFYRADSREADAGSLGASTGAGLGLPIAQWIARAHHGDLVLLRSDASGSAFAIRLPVSATA